MSQITLTEELFADMKDALLEPFLKYDDLYDRPDLLPCPENHPVEGANYSYMNFSYLSRRKHMRAWHIEEFFKWFFGKLKVPFDWSFFGGRCIVTYKVEDEVDPFQISEWLDKLIPRLESVK